jgi:hypothetical protein
VSPSASDPFVRTLYSTSSEGTPTTTTTPTKGPMAAPFRWKQESSTISVSFEVPPGTPKNSIDVSITSSSLVAGLKGQPPILSGTLFDHGTYHPFFLLRSNGFAQGGKLIRTASFSTTTCRERRIQPDMIKNRKKKKYRMHEREREGMVFFFFSFRGC